VKNQKARNLAISAIFFALLLLELFIPNIGNIYLFPAMPAVTTIPLTIAIYSVLLGARAGMGLGIVWGVISMFLAYTRPTSLVSIFLFQNPIIAIIPRALSGYLAGIVALKNNRLYYCLSGLISSLTNTVFVIILASVILTGNQELLAHLGHTNGNLLVLLTSALAFNGILEAIFSAILAPIILKPLIKIMQYK
jgi:integral membrane protein